MSGAAGDLIQTAAVVAYLAAGTAMLAWLEFSTRPAVRHSGWHLLLASSVVLGWPLWIVVPLLLQLRRREAGR